MEKAIAAIDYWQTVSRNRPNGWGQQIHPEYGQSHYCLMKYQNDYGKESFNKSLDVLFNIKESV